MTTSPEQSFAQGSRRIREARRLCTQLLAECMKPFDAPHSFVYAVADRDRLVIVAETAGEWAGGIGSATEGRRSRRDERADMAAMQALRTGRSLVTGERRIAGDVVAIPCVVDGEVLAVAVVKGVTGGRSAMVELDSTALLALGLAVERYKVQTTLEESLAESDAVRRQLDAYAVDLRSTYLAERARSVELASALEQLSQTYESTVRGLATAVEAKDEYTGGHLHRVSRYGMAITAVVAPGHARDPQFEYGFLLHDVGKLVVPDAILMKEGPLNEREWAMIRGHPDAGRTIIDSIPFLAGANEIVRSHHERWDGKGYPRGLHGEEIPLGARIFALADAFDAMTTTRPYRRAMSVDEARVELERGSGTQFWPEAIDAFMTIAIEDLDVVRDEENQGHAR